MVKKRTLYIALFFSIMFIYLAIASTTPGISGNVKVIKLEGIIADSDSIFSSGTSSSEFIDQIKDAEENPAIKAILIKINSGGGSAVTSEEIMKSIRDSNKPTVALIRDVGASGAYWAASAADSVVASPISITGSVGVTSSYIEFTQFFEKYGIGYERLVAGEFKDAGTPLRNLTQKERDHLQAMLDDTHNYFLDSVAQNRELSVESQMKVKTAAIYSGRQAQEIGLVDILGGESEAVEEIEKMIGEEAKLIESKKSPTLTDLLVRQSAIAGKAFFSSVLNQEFSLTT